MFNKASVILQVIYGSIFVETLLTFLQLACEILTVFKDGTGFEISMFRLF